MKSLAEMEKSLQELDEKSREDCEVLEERWLNGSAPDCKSVVLGSNPAPPQHTANSVNPEVGNHLGSHSTVCWLLRVGRGTQYTQKKPKNI